MNDLTSVIGEKWYAGISAAGLTRLTEASKNINQLHQAARDEMVRKAIDIGKELMVARDLFKGDNEFGTWCAEQFPWAKRGTLYNMRALAVQVGTARITGKLLSALPVSQLFELLPASDKVVKAVEAAVENDEKPTVAEIRKAKTEDRAPEPAPAPATAAPAPRPAPVMAPRAPLKPTDPADDFRVAQTLINKPFFQRYEELEKQYPVPQVEHAYILFGLDPNPCCHPNPYTIDVLYAEIKKGRDKKEEGYKEMMAYVDACEALIAKDRKEFHS